MIYSLVVKLIFINDKVGSELKPLLLNKQLSHKTDQDYQTLMYFLVKLCNKVKFKRRRSMYIQKVQINFTLDPKSI